MNIILFHYHTHFLVSVISVISPVSSHDPNKDAAVCITGIIGHDESACAYWIGVLIE